MTFFLQINSLKVLNTSQYFANIYLNELDQYVKHKLKVKYYVRYMDDFILLLNNKQECIQIKKTLRHFCKAIYS